MAACIKLLLKQTRLSQLRSILYEPTYKTTPILSNACIRCLRNQGFSDSSGQKDTDIKTTTNSETAETQQDSFAESDRVHVKLDTNNHSVSQISQENKSFRQPKADYSYFKHVVTSANNINNSNPSQNTFKETFTSVEQSATNPDNSQISETTEESTDLDLYKDININSIKPAMPKESFNLATYVSRSETLSNLVKLGVDLSQVEKHRQDANHLLKLDFKRDVQPYLNFLHSIGIPDSLLGNMLSKNPGLFREDLDDLQVRINYFLSKKFDEAAVARIVSKAPLVLSTTTKEMDTQLGYLQKEFKLTGDEVRSVITRCPKVATWSRIGIKQAKFTLEEFLGFSEPEMKQMLIAQPKLYLTDRYALKERFDYLHNVIGLTHEQILQWPDVLRTRSRIIVHRHKFLKHMSRDQFDATKENYVSLKAMVACKDAEFCSKVAKVPVKLFNEFLKTL